MGQRDKQRRCEQSYQQVGKKCKGSAWMENGGFGAEKSKNKMEDTFAVRLRKECYAFRFGLRSFHLLFSLFDSLLFRCFLLLTFLATLSVVHNTLAFRQISDRPRLFPQTTILTTSHFLTIPLRQILQVVCLFALTHVLICRRVASHLHQGMCEMARAVDFSIGEALEVGNWWLVEQMEDFSWLREDEVLLRSQLMHEQQGKTSLSH